MREKRCLIQSDLIQGESYGPADPVRVKDDTQKVLKTAEAGRHEYSGRLSHRSAGADWGDVAARYRAVVLTMAPRKRL